MKRFTIMFLILTAISYLCLDKSFAQSSSEMEIQQLKQMIQENSKQNEELMRRIQQLESDNAAKDAEFEKFMTAQEAKDLKYDGIMTFFDSIDLGFAVDTTYQYVFNRGVTDSLQLRALYPDNQQFSLNAFTISVSKTPTMDGGLMDLLGFRADILFGEQAAELGGDGFDSDVVDPYQAYLNVLAPIGTGLNIYAGRFVTLAGYEVIEGYKNPNISRGILFGYALPFTHTGIRFGYTAGMITLTAGLNNGWDQVQELNDSPTIESQIAFDYSGDTITSAWVGVTGIFGKEPSGLGFGGEGWRELITAVASVTLFDKLTLVADADFGWQQDVVFDEFGNEEGVTWWGIAGYVIVDPHPAVTLALRGEYFDDKDGYRTGLAQKLFEFTPTIALKPFKGLIANNKYLDNFEARAEFRWDHSDERYFITKDDGLKKDQYGIMGQLLYWIEL